MIYLIFILGAVLGSFYLVIGTRLPKGLDVLTSRSKCDHCDYQLKWYNLIPIISYVVQLGKCNKCGKKIAIEHLLVEIATGLGFSLLYYIYGFSYIFYGGIVIYSLLIIILITDLKYFIIWIHQ